jgi:putative FmdB family regulatory protein
MPLYEYQCEACGRRFEQIQKFSDPPADTCRLCGAGPVVRLMSSPAIQFKGTGWYITDYSQKGKAPASESGDAGKSAAGDSKSDSKTDTKTDTKSPDAGSSGDTGAKPAAAATTATPSNTESS